MGEGNFESIFAEFALEYHPLKPLAETMRPLLFPIKDRAMWTRTDSLSKAVHSLYDGFIGAFEVAISQEQNRSLLE